MREFSMIVVVLINVFITIRYGWLIWRQKIKPSLATWTFFGIAVGGSLVTYLLEGDYRPWDNILNTADVGLVVSVIAAILLWGDRSSRFNRFDRGCLIAVLIIVAFWLVTRNHVVAHLLIQAIMVVAYFPVASRLWRSDQNTESFVAWIGMMVAPMVALLSSKGILAAVYSLRAIVSIAVLLVLMVRAELRSRKCLSTDLLDDCSVLE